MGSVGGWLLCKRTSCTVRGGLLAYDCIYEDALDDDDEYEDSVLGSG